MRYLLTKRLPLPSKYLHPFKPTYLQVYNRLPKQLSTMSHTDMNKMFKDETFIDNYKIAEKATGVFGEAMIEQSSIVSEANSNPEKPLVIFDNACGTGIVAKMLNEKIDAQAKNNWKLTCGDLSEGMVEYSRREGQAGGWPNAEFKVVDAQDNKLPSDHFTHVFTAFGMGSLGERGEVLANYL